MSATNKTLTGLTEQAWPDPQILGSDLPPVEPLALEFLPDCLRSLVADVSELMQVPYDFAAAAGIVALAGCVNRRALIQPKVEDNSWSAVPNLWGCIIAAPGLMKSPVLAAMTLPLARIEAAWRADYEAAALAFMQVEAESKNRLQVWGELSRKAEKNCKPGPLYPSKPPEPPQQRRLLLTDATYEKLHDILKANPAGVLVVRDELTGWLASLDRAGREGERQFYLQAWNGDSGFQVDRIGRGSSYVPHVCVSLLGCIQPARLRWYLSQTLEGGPADDGLLQRFQFAVWPDHSGDWNLVDRKPNSAALEKVERVFSTLANLSADEPALLRFNGAAQELFYSWLADLEFKVRSESSLHPAQISHLAKFRKLMPGLCGLFELADCVAEGRQPHEISLAHAQQAAEMCAYLEKHARRIYSCIATPELHAARELTRHIRRGELKEDFTTRDVYASHWSGLDKPDAARLALELLEDAGWLRSVESKFTGGRRSENWQLNPKVVSRA